MSFTGDGSSHMMWAPVLAFSCILAMLGILLALPFLLTRARRMPALNWALDKLAVLMGAPWPPIEERPPEHVRKPLSRAQRNNLVVTHYKPHSTATAMAGGDCEAPSDGGECCPICFSDYFEGQAIITLRCKHFFHKECISRWLKRDATCPMCKHNLQETQHSASMGSVAASGAPASSSRGVEAANAAMAATATAAASGVPVAAASPAEAAAAAAAEPMQASTSNAAPHAERAAAEVLQPAGQSAGSSSPAPLQAVVVTVQ